MKPKFDPAIPIYLQIMERIKEQIVSGERRPGSKVESVRELAHQMAVNPNTMQRAFAELERAGLLYTERTSGRFITEDKERILRIKRESACKIIGDFVKNMENLGFSKEEMIQMLREEGGEPPWNR